MQSGADPVSSHRAIPAAPEPIEYQIEIRWEPAGFSQRAREFPHRYTRCIGGACKGLKRVPKGFAKPYPRVPVTHLQRVQVLPVPLQNALLAWCRRRIRPVAAGHLAGRAWPAAGVTWARPSASTAAPFTTARTRTALAGAAGAASATLCHDALRRRVIPAPPKATPGAHLWAHNCVPICAPKIIFS